MSGRVLHLLSQRPSLTGSGVTIDALVRHAAASGWQQRVVVGTPVDDPLPSVGGLDDDRVRPLRFGAGGDLPFAVPGMSDVMPYRSTRFSSLTDEQLRAYRQRWSAHLETVLEETRPDLIHAHHVWLLSAMLKDVAPELPVVVQCHATGLRQMKLCPHLAEQVRRGCARNDAFLTLHAEHAEALVEALGIEPDRVFQVGAGYRDDLFHRRGRHAGGHSAPLGRRAGVHANSVPNDLIYVGKYAAAKGLPWLLDAVERLGSDVTLHVAGSGAGPEAEGLRRRMEGMPQVQQHGQRTQAELADLLRQAAVCVLPSFYEGLPLVLIEALACGCRLVATELPGVVDELVPHVGAAIELVPLPRLEAVDRPLADDQPAFVDALTEALATALRRPPLEEAALSAAIAPFTWSTVFGRVERIWRRCLRSTA